jgi:precorrin-2 dehydrogenase/sirohydrochlorin ferrochelatase
VGYFPVMLDVTSRPVVVVGSGAAAVAKIERLLAAEALVAVFDQRPDCPLPPAMRDTVRWFPRWPEPADVKGAALVILAHEDGAVNRRLLSIVRQTSVLVNVVDQPSLSDCIMVSHLRRGPLVVSVSTSGCAPGMARRIREALESLFDDQWPERLERVRQVRFNVREESDGAEARERIRVAEDRAWTSWQKALRHTGGDWHHDTLGSPRGGRPGES